MDRYPGRAVRRGDPRSAIVKQVQARLAGVLGERVIADGAFGPVTLAAVLLYQTRAGLEADGIVGPVTWAALAGAGAPLLSGSPLSPLVRLALQIAEAQVGVRELPGNRGPEVTEYLASVGLLAGHPWCVAFAFWCFENAARQLGTTNPLPRTAGVHAHYQRAPERAKLGPDALHDDLRGVGSGALFCIDHGSGKGHMGIITKVDATGVLHTVEGNTVAVGVRAADDRDGDGVRRRTRRQREITLGYVDYGRLYLPDPGMAGR